jgi:hypothetical protein
MVAFPISNWVPSLGFEDKTFLTLLKKMSGVRGPHLSTADGSFTTSVGGVSARFISGPLQGLNAVEYTTLEEVD